MTISRPLWASQRGASGLWRGGLWRSQMQGGGGTDWSGVNIGDEVEGGIYAGQITYADAREFHIVFAKQEGEADPAFIDTRWSTAGTTTGATDPDDGAANVIVLSDAGIANFPAAQYCLEYTGGGRNDWSLPAINELSKVQVLLNMSHPEFQTGNSGFENFRWSSTESNAPDALFKRFSDGFESTFDKTDVRCRIRPIRRIPV